ncbi:MAG: diacylglycerol kinase family lipid kinase [Bacteroidales bacterium]
MEELAEARWLVVVNPNAGTRKGERDWNKISGLLDKNGLDYHPVFTERRLHAMKLTVEFIQRGFRKIIVVGGDGTMNEVVNGIFKQKSVPTAEIILGMISVGTGNDWGRTFNIPTEYAEAIRIIHQGSTLVQDAGIVKYQNTHCEKTRFFINMAGLGFDGLVAQKTNQDKDLGHSNPFVYIKNLISSLFSYKSSQIKVTVDDVVITDKIFSIGIGIGQYNGGGMRQTPDALPDDGLFDVTLIKDMKKWSVIKSLRRLYNGTIGQHKRVETFVGKFIRIESDIPVLLETDGESLGHSPFEFQIVPKSIQVIVNT